MPISLENFTIHRLVVHEIYKREGTGSMPPTLNRALTVLDANGNAELQKRVVEAVGHNSHAIGMDVVQTDEGSAYANISPFLNAAMPDEDFIAMSHRLVNKLFTSQTSQIVPGGVVLIFQGITSSRNHKCIGVIKADKLSGFAVSTSDATAVMDFLNNLLLTPQQKLYKVALLARKSEGEQGSGAPDDITVAVFDSNNNKASSNASAIYFYNTFLGCTFQQNNDVLTKDFFNHTKDFITKKSGLSGVELTGVMSALYVYMKVRTDNRLNVASFAQEYFAEPEMRDNYQAYMTSKKVPATDIVRDNSMILSKLKKRRIKFTNAVDLYAPVDDFSNNVEILESIAGSTTLKINGTVKTES